jgi:hypothetical protein
MVWSPHPRLRTRIEQRAMHCKAAPSSRWSDHHMNTALKQIKPSRDLHETTADVSTQRPMGCIPASRTTCFSCQDRCSGKCNAKLRVGLITTCPICAKANLDAAAGQRMQRVSDPAPQDTAGDPSAMSHLSQSSHNAARSCQAGYRARPDCLSGRTVQAKPSKTKQRRSLL